MRKIIGIVIALVVGMTAKAEEVSIATADQLRALSSSWSNSNTYKLTADIDLGNSAWTPIGTSDSPFTATFDGQRHTITRLSVNVSGNQGSVIVAGLFGVIGNGGVVKDLNIGSTNILITSQENNNSYYSSVSVGAIAGTNAGTIVGCANRGVSVSGNYEHSSVGGIAGQNSGTIANCYNLGDVYSTTGLNDNYLGGIVGRNLEGGNLKNCFARKSTPSGSGTVSPIYGPNSNLENVSSCFYLNGASTDDIGIEVTISDTESNTITTSESAQDVLLQDRTLYCDASWNTICLPFSIAQGYTGYSPIAGADVRELTAASFESSTGTLSLTFADATSIEAGKPYIIRWKNAIASNLSNPVFMGVTISNDTPTGVTKDLGSNRSIQFIGKYSPLSIASEDKTKLYLGSSNKLFYPSKAMTIKSCRAIFQLTHLTAGEPASSQASARFFSIDFGDGEEPEVTAIEAMEYTETVSDNHWYTIGGMRLSERPTQKGIYINNGRKVVIR